MSQNFDDVMDAAYARNGKFGGCICCVCSMCASTDKCILIEILPLANLCAQPP